MANSTQIRNDNWGKNEKEVEGTDRLDDVSYLALCFFRNIIHFRKVQIPFMNFIAAHISPNCSYFSQLALTHLFTAAQRKFKQ